ncbi:hypothetical protein AB0F81_24805 [Actinoplanes sp. NPDC024001]|uniref:hypothetical protein n=1 Tax=Actinoplanes sp. NPDC024001 TaxID=3154598 RepID=UPI0033C1D54D
MRAEPGAVAGGAAWFAEPGAVAGGAAWFAEPGAVAGGAAWFAQPQDARVTASDTAATLRTLPSDVRRQRLSSLVDKATGDFRL